METVRAILQSSTPIKQTMKSSQIKWNYVTNTSIKISKTFEKSQEIGIGVQIEDDFEMVLQKVHFGGSISHENNGKMKTTINLEQMIIVPPQEMILNLQTQISVASDFLSKKVITDYMVDLYIDYVLLQCLEGQQCHDENNSINKFLAQVFFFFLNKIT